MFLHVDKLAFQLAAIPLFSVGFKQVKPQSTTGTHA
jgi:hypothetical protein